MSADDSDVTFEVALADRAGWPLSGSDIMIAQIHGPLASNEEMLNWAADVGEGIAGLNDGMLHHARFTFTSDPDTVRRQAALDEHPDCPRCLQGQEIGLGLLAENPEAVVIVGQIYLCRDPGGT